MIGDALGVVIGVLLLIHGAALLHAVLELREKRNGRHRQAAETLQGGAAAGDGAADPGAVAGAAARVASATAFANFAYATIGARRAGTGGVMARQKVNPTTGRHTLRHAACARCGSTTTGWNLCSNGLCVACDMLVGGTAPPATGRCTLCGSSSFPLGPGGFCQSCYLQTTGGAGWHQAAVPGGVVMTGGGGGGGGGRVVVGPLVMPGTVPLNALSPDGRMTASEPLPRDFMPVPMDLIGWRIWRVTGSGYLHSLAVPVIWLPGEPMEAAEVTDYGAASNGIHVFADKAGAIREMATYCESRGPPIGGNFALGSVLLWGDVVEHERGYRAERAKILSIDDVVWEGKPPWDAETKRALAFLRERYGVAG